MCLYKEGGISGYDSMNLAYQKFCVHKKLLQERDRKIYTAMQPLLDDVEMFMKTAMAEIEKKANIKNKKIGEITIIPNFNEKNKYAVELPEGKHVIINDRHEAEKLSEILKNMHSDV